MWKFHFTNFHFEVGAAFSELWILSHITFHAAWKADALGDRFETSEVDIFQSIMTFEAGWNDLGNL